MAYGGYRVELEGTLGADPVISTVGDKSVLNVRIAHSARVKQGDRLTDSATTWFKGVMWQRGANDDDLQNIVASLQKGDRVRATGAAYSEAWDSRDGKSGVTNVLELESVAPSLRFATAQPVKNQRGGGSAAGWGGQSPQAQQGWGQSTPPADGQQSFGGFDDEPML